MKRTKLLIACRFPSADLPKNNKATFNFKRERMEQLHFKLEKEKRFQEIFGSK